MYSNIRLLDCINRPEGLIDKAIELGLSGIAITDHECLSAHVEVNQYAQKIHESHPDFTIALGNEIYLTETRDNKQKYYHFLLMAKDAIGHKGLRELSSTAWLNSYFDRGMERVPLLKSELKDIMEKYKGHIIATTACIGGELGTLILKLTEAEEKQEVELAQSFHNDIVKFITYCQDIFSDDFYIECAPATSREQIIVNKRLLKIANAFNIKMCVGTDAHYLVKDDRYVHKAYLNSKNGEREIDSFYEFTYLMTEDEVKELLSASFDISTINWIIDCSNEIKSKIQFYSLEHTSIIPTVEVKDYPKSISWWGVNNDLADEVNSNYPIIKSLCLSDNIQERYWINECLQALQDKGLFDNFEYWDRLETEADVIKYIGNELDTCLFAYFNTFKHYIDLFWECGSIVGPGRGSATGFLSNYLLGITQLNPIRWELPYWRFLNKARSELPDIDIDLAPSKRPAIFAAIREERGPLGLVQVATFGTEGTKSSVLTACRGYRSEEYPDGIDVDIAQYMSSLIPQERGFLWPLKDVVYGNKEKDRKPIKLFIDEVNQYDGLLDIMMRIEGLVNKRSSHASGVILYDNDPYKTAAFMKTPSGDIITQYDLHRAEFVGDTKYDFLVTEVSDKIIKCFELLQNDGVIEKLSLRDTYNKYLHPEILDTTNQAIWDHLAAGDILDVFQFSEGSGLAIAKKTRPQNPIEMTAANAMMRLMNEKGKESQQDRFVRMKANPLLFDKEMRQYKLPEGMIQTLHKYCDEYFGCCPIQEQIMQILMDENVAGFTLKEANAARKIIAKKQMDKIPDLRKQVYDKINNETQFEYIWETVVAPQLGQNESLCPYTPNLLSQR